MGTPPRFDSTALFQALDELRLERGVAWQQLADEAGVAASTLKRTQAGGAMEADGALALIRLTGRAPETFAAGLPAGSEPLGRGRFDTCALHRALDEERQRRGLSWADAARATGAGSAAALRRLERGGRISADLMLACVWWLGRRVNDFVDPEFEHPGERSR